MTHLLDTNICSAHMRRPGGLGHRFIQYSGGIAVPTIVLAELYAGAYKKTNPATLLVGIEDLLLDVSILDFDTTCAEEFGRLSGTLVRAGMRMPIADLMIATVALVYDLTLVTNNTADFQKIPNLRLVDWLTP